MENHEMNRTDTPTPQPDLSDAALSQLAEAIFEMDIVDAVKAVRSVRDQARATERKRALEWAAEFVRNHLLAESLLDYRDAKELRHATEEGAKDA
jgi:hypothetical protein